MVVLRVQAACSEYKIACTQQIRAVLLTPTTSIFILTFTHLCSQEGILWLVLTSFARLDIACLDQLTHSLLMSPGLQQRQQSYVYINELSRFDSSPWSHIASYSVCDFTHANSTPCSAWPGPAVSQHVKRSQTVQG